MNERMMERMAAGRRGGAKAPAGDTRAAASSRFGLAESQGPEIGPFFTRRAIQGT